MIKEVKQDEKPQPRPVAVISQEYSNLCTKAGHVQYQIDAMSKDLALMNQKLRDLNLEVTVSKRAENEAKAEAALEEAKKVEAPSV